MNKITREQFFRLGIGVFGTVTLTSICSKKRPLDVETKDGSFHLGMYGHGIRDLIVPRPVKEEDIPPSVDAIFLEGFSGSENEFFEGPQKKTEEPSKKETEASSNVPSFDFEAFFYAFKHEIPIYYGDPYGARDIRLFYTLTLAPVATELALAIRLKKIAQESFSRREFLVGVPATGAALLYATEPGLYIAALLNPLLTQPWAKTVREMVNRAEELHRREDFAIVFRNAEKSYKLLSVAQQLRENKGRKPEIVGIGGHHRGIEYWLKQGKERCLQVMKEYPKLFLETIFGLDRQECARRISSTLEIRFGRDGKFEPTMTLYHDPELFKAMGGEGIIPTKEGVEIPSLSGGKERLI